MKTMAGKTEKYDSQNKQISRNPAQKDAANGDLYIKLFELLQGERDTLRFYSKTPESQICIVNFAIIHVDELKTDCPVYSIECITILGRLGCLSGN